VISTALQMPKLLDNDWPNHFPNDTVKQRAARQVFTDFQKRMGDLATDIDAANSLRRWPFANFNPKNLQCSVSI